MAYKVDATLSDVEAYHRANRLDVSFEQIERQVKSGAKLEIECSSFSDPGEDWTRLLLDGRQVGYWPGY